MGVPDVVAGSSAVHIPGEWIILVARLELGDGSVFSEVVVRATLMENREIDGVLG